MGSMTTLQIEHSISDYPLWKAAFDRFAARRQESGVRRHRITRPPGDPAYIVVDLDFDRAEQAEGFLAFLRSTVWSTPDNAPALVGAPRARLLEVVEEVRF